MVKKGNENGWRQAAVLLRADILDEIKRQGRDLNEECNLALADRYGIDYRQQKIPETALPNPVIIAPNSVPPITGKTSDRSSKPASFSGTPVLNAEDPRIAKALKSGEISRQPPPKAPRTVTSPRIENEAGPSDPAEPAIPKTAKTPSGGATPSRRKKEDPIKIFVSSMITRDAAPGALVTKDAMYSAFERWCHDKKFVPVPPKRSFGIALKNQYAFTEKNSDGVPSWINVSLKLLAG